MSEFQMQGTTILSESNGNVTWGAGAPAGSLLKVYSVTFTGITSTISQSENFQPVGGTSTGNLTITTDTPINSNSKYLLMAHVTHSISSSSRLTFRFYDDTGGANTAIEGALSDQNGSSRVRGSFGPGHWSTGPSIYPTNVSSMNHLYAPSSSTALTLSVKGALNDTTTHYYNRAIATNDVDWMSDSVSSFTVMEIAG